ncbi:Crescent membrane/immature virion protein [Eptesipox virus]|uniref:Crescent membrane/immature virion protein n=1 Tax=Eptesipox virus TaxID=1329402 RepID=A0A220T6C6_9POXV|nr:Crescent membrane/immature virion protein [Eptesipox virus]ASK51266.1 Crescent membrane/immature virion protein [Eptesipox virus]WAH71024.1 crescent membrane/immature virion protein [Eptesipox virus]
MAEILTSKLDSIKKENKFNEIFMDAIINEIENTQPMYIKLFFRFLIDFILLMFVIFACFIRVFRRNYTIIFLTCVTIYVAYVFKLILLN